MVNSSERIFRQRFTSAAEMRGSFFTNLDASLEDAVAAYKSQQTDIILGDAETGLIVIGEAAVSEILSRHVPYSPSPDGFMSKYSSYIGLFFGSDAGKHLERIVSMAEYSLEDVLRVAEIEAANDSQYGLFFDGDTLEFERKVAQLSIFSQAKVPGARLDVKKRTHNFIAQMGTLSDNVYQLACDYFRLECLQDADFKKSVEKGLREQGHGKLEKLMAEKFSFSGGLRGLPAMRNETLHNVPSYKVDMAGEQSDAATNGPVRPMIEYRVKGSIVREPLFDFMIGIYGHMLGAASAVLDYLARDIREKVEKGNL